MKRYGNLFEKIYEMENLKTAHKNAKKGKGWYSEVRKVNENEEYYLKQLQDMLITKSYKTSEYETFIKRDSGKEREIYKLPYFPDRICQWAILQIIEPILINNFTTDTYSAIPKRGIHLALKRLTGAVQNNPTETKYCLKIDVKKYYPSINHDILKSKYRRIFKDEELLWLLDEIIDSTPGDTGIPIGNYLSQYSGNFYLSSFDHWLKEVKKIKYYYRYMDDIVILHQSKEFLHQLKHEISEYFSDNLRLTIKRNWQVFPTGIRGIDFVGYRTFPSFILLRKGTCKRFKHKMRSITKEQMTYSSWCSVNSYKGWLMHCNSHRLIQKYITPIKPLLDGFYRNNIKRKEA